MVLLYPIYYLPFTNSSSFCPFDGHLFGCFNSHSAHMTSSTLKLGLPCTPAMASRSPPVHHAYYALTEKINEKKNPPTLDLQTYTTHNGSR